MCRIRAKHKHNLVISIVNIQIALLVSPLFAESNDTIAQKIAVPFDKCKPEKGVSFKGNSTTKLSSDELKELLTGNTLVSVDRYGVFAIYYPSNEEAIGWMPKEKSKGYSWSSGSVSFENDRYCRKWKEWTSGKNTNCWEAHRGEQRMDKPSFYYVCKNGTPDGDQSIVFEGNYLNVEFTGNGKKTGTLSQDDKKAEATWEKYFSNYTNK